MRVDLLPAEQWEDLNQALRSELHPPEDVSIRCYHGLAHAVYETAMSTAQLFSHKRSVGVVKGLTPAFTSVLPSLYKEGFQVQTLQNQDMKASVTWAEALKKDTNFVLFSSDHPLTGAKNSWQDLDKTLNDKKIYSFRISHRDWLRDLASAELKIQPYSALIASISPTLAVVFCGAKFRSPSLLAPYLFWDAKLANQQLQESIGQFAEEKDVVLNFEKSLPQNWKSFFPADMTAELRLFDRAIIYDTTFNSEAVLQELVKLQKRTLLTPAFEQRVESANLCRWGGVKLYEDWWEAKPEPNVIRGMLCIDVKELKTANFKTNLEEATKACRI